MSKIDFSDLGEDLSEGLIKAKPKDKDEGLMGQTYSEATVARYEAKCPVPQCRKGSWIAYTGRVVGPCRRCNGTGIIKTRTNPITLKKNREQARAKRAEQAQANDQKAAQFLADNPAIATWFEKNRAGFDFARDLYSNLYKYGTLTEKQIAAVQKMVDRDAEWKVAKIEASKVQDLDMSGLVEIFANASEHLKRPRLIIGDLLFTKAPDTGKNAGFLYAKMNGEYAGKISPRGEFVKAWGCNDEVVEKIRAISCDPLAAAQAHGHDTGNCSACGRMLTNELSIELGIGPICRGRWGI